MGIGTLVGSLVLARFEWASLASVAGGGLALGGTTALAAMSPGPTTFVVLLGFVGLAAMIMIGSATSLIQVVTRPELRGRVSSLFTIVTLLGVPVASGPLGLIAQWAGARWALGTCGGVVMIGVGLVVARRLLLEELENVGR